VSFSERLGRGSIDLSVADTTGSDQSFVILEREATIPIEDATWAHGTSLLKELIDSLGVNNSN
jgi:hypothetical protein